MEAASDRIQLLYRNAKQMKKIVEAKYTNLRYDEKVLDAKELGFECSSLDVSPTRCLKTNSTKPLTCAERTAHRRSVLGLSMAESCGRNGIGRRCH